MISGFLSLFKPTFPRVVVYMLQNVEYQPGAYLAWFWRTKNFDTVMQRRVLDKTHAARMLYGILVIGLLLQLCLGIALIVGGVTGNIIGGVSFGLAVVVIAPVLWAHLIVLPLIFGRELSVKPRERRAIAQSEKIFANHSATTIAVVGSYGKTTMKELLNTVLSQGLNVAATPANKNVASSHAVFARTLTGDEDVLIIEYGEGQPGDVAQFAKTTHPDIAIITGVAPAHLDQYKTLEAAATDIFSVQQFVDPDRIYVNGESSDALPHASKPMHIFSAKHAIGWRVVSVEAGLQGTAFVISKGSRKLKLHSSLLGIHHVGFLVFVAALASELGLSDSQIKKGIAATHPFEHRMQPYALNGATIIDDTYNGNIEGIRAGTQLLASNDANRKIYVTPGLVDQGPETAAIHIEVGKLIAAAHPDIVVLMQNSVTPYIEEGLKVGEFSGELRIESHPLEFYTNLKHIVAHGDLVVMQNDWTDNYA